MGSMANLMCYREGSSANLVNSIESGFKTMQLVEAAYESSGNGGILVDY
jgi:hypothetical protein